VALAGALFALQAVFAPPLVADTAGGRASAGALHLVSATLASAEDPAPGQDALQPANDVAPATTAKDAALGQGAAPPGNDASPPPSAKGPESEQGVAPPATAAPPPSAEGSTAAQVAARPGALPPATAAKPDALRNNLRLAMRVGAPSDMRAARHIGDSGLGATYFMTDRAYSIFVNLEAVSLFVDKGYDHFESEINLGINPFYARPWLAPVSFTARVTTDWTEDKTLSFGPSINLTNLPFMAPVKAAGFNFFFQYYPIKTDNHWGDQDFMFYWSIPLYARRLSLRGFARLFISYHAQQQAAISNDLIFELIPGVDIFFRDAETINEEAIPRRAGVSLGLRWLQKF
jgi:hypothetical protein